MPAVGIVIGVICVLLFLMFFFRKVKSPEEPKSEIQIGVIITVTTVPAFIYVVKTEYSEFAYIVILAGLTVIALLGLGHLTKIFTDKNK